MAVAIIVILAIMALMTVDVIGREALNRPLLGGVELVELLLVVAVFAALPFVSYRERHITADLFDAVLGARSRLLLRMFGCLLGAFMFALAVPQMKRLAERAHSFGDITAQFGVPISWPLYFMMALCAITALAFAARALLLLVELAGHKILSADTE